VSGATVNMSGPGGKDQQVIPGSKSFRTPAAQNFDAFISCRYVADGPFAMALYEKLQMKTICTFWFTDVVRPGRNMMERTVSSLMKSTVFVPVMSSKMFADKVEDTATDYVLAEWLCALIFYKSKAHLHTVRLLKICPVLVEDGEGTTLLNCRNSFPITKPTQTIANVLDVFDRMFFNLNESLRARVSDWTYRDIFDEMAMHYAIAVVQQELVKVVDRLEAVVRTVKERSANTATISPEYHGFLSYRGLQLAADRPFVNKILDAAATQYFEGKGIKVYCDLHCLDEGDNYLDKAIDGIKNSTVFIPIVSMAAIQPMMDHDPDQLDLLLAEWICALLFWHIPSCRLRSVLPLLIKNDENDGQSAYFKFRSRISNKVPTRTIRVVLEAFDRLQIVVESKLSEKVCSWTVNEILNRLMENMGLDSDYTEGSWPNTFVEYLSDVLSDLPEDRFINATSTFVKGTSVSRVEFKCNTVSVDIIGSVDDRVVKAQFLDATNTNVQCFVKHAQFPDESKYINDELKILKTLNSNNSSEKSCVKVFGFGVNYKDSAEYIYFVMEAFGTDLSVILDGTCPKLTAYSLAIKIVDSVRSVHSVGIMHGDLKPKNILFKHNGKDFKVKLCDFDCARGFGDLFPYEDLAFKCTTAYMCPELCKNSQYYVRPGDLIASAQPDLFSLGLILWQLFSSGCKTSIIENNDLVQLLHDVNNWELQLMSIEHCPDMGNVIVKLCRPKPSDRQLDYRAVKQLLDGATRLTEKIGDYRDALALTANNVNSAVSSILETQLSAYFLDNYGVLARMCNDIKTHNADMVVAVAQKQEESTVTIMKALQDVVAEASGRDGAFQGLKLELSSFMSEIERSASGSDAKLEKIISVAGNLQNGVEKVVLLVNKVKDDLVEFSDFTRKQADSNGGMLSNLHHVIERTVINEAQSIIREIKQGELESRLKLNTLLKGNYLMPTMFIVVPDISKGTLMEKFNPTHWIKDRFRFYFVCAHTLQIVCCGPDGTGYRFSALKQWVARAAPVLLAGLCLLQLAMTASGLPIPIPGISHLYNAAQNKTDICQKLFNDTAQYIRTFKNNYDVAVDGIQGALLEAMDSDPANLAVQAGSISAAVIDVTAEESRAAYRAVQELMEKHDPNLESTGLRFVVDDCGVSQWIADSDSVEESFRQHAGQRRPPVPVSDGVIPR
jgi:serine/threonine protein kinase